ncbi:putative zinc-binding protein [Uliginosibacterium flavum]|uniref:Zinc-binding protein n=1 Tax=Uliginosibacterium flavum TaxID=1396831 RepID=A0ABV2TQ67_9RHOO
MKKALPLIYACSGCSAAGQLANALAVQMDREENAQMSCISGVGGKVPALLALARSGRKIIAVDGCAMRCTEQSLREAGVGPDAKIFLAEMSVSKGVGQEFRPEDLTRLLPEIRRQCAALIIKYESPQFVSVQPFESGFMTITG